MKYIYILILMFLGNNLFAFEDKELFVKANDFFLEGNFIQAQKNYEKIAQKNSYVWQNLGNAYYNQQLYLDAFISWQRAEKNADFFQMLQLYNLQDTVMVKLDAVHQSDLQKWFLRTVLLLPLLLLQLLLFIFLLSLLFVMYQYVIHKKNHLSCTSLVMILGIIILLVTSLYIQYKYKHKKYAVVIHHQSGLHIGPEKSFYQKAQLQQGSVVHILESKNNMYKVSCGQKSGWIFSENIELV